MEAVFKWFSILYCGRLPGRKLQEAPEDTGVSEPSFHFLKLNSNHIPLSRRNGGRVPFCRVQKHDCCIEPFVPGVNTGYPGTRYDRAGSQIRNRDDSRVSETTSSRSTTSTTTR
eukprot:3934077-Rhodomonas_salina.1